ARARGAAAGADPWALDGAGRV
ncbi:MAG: hypothetical protein AVDCRST_MAG91-807, partial [uncultured Sphingomonadaceae bacterium]